MSDRHRHDVFGALIGFLTFLGGIALLVLTFKLAYDMFSVPPESALGIDQKKAVDLARAGESLTTILGRVVLLLVMAGVGSLVANRGIKLYVSARALSHPHVDRTKAEVPETAAVRDS